MCEIWLKHISLFNSPNFTKITICLTGTEDLQGITDLPFHHVAPDHNYFQPIGLGYVPVSTTLHTLGWIWQGDPCAVGLR